MRNIYEVSMKVQAEYFSLVVHEFTTNLKLLQDTLMQIGDSEANFDVEFEGDIRLFVSDLLLNLETMIP